MAYTFSYLDSAGKTQTTTTDQDLRQTAGGAKFTLVEEQPTQPPAPTQPAPTGTVKVSSPSELGQFTEDQITRQGQDIYANVGQKINDPSQLSQYKESDILRLGGSIYLKPVIATPYNPSNAQMSIGDTSSNLSTDDFGKSLMSPVSALNDNTENINAFRNNLAQVTNSFLSGLEAEIANINNQWLTINQQQQQKAQAEVDRLSGLYEQAGRISLYDESKALLERFQVEANLKLYQDLQTKAVDASKIMQDAIDNYDTTAYLTSVVSARKNQLYKQGLNVITSLQATAEIVKGNIDLAGSYVDRMLGALESDRTTQLNTYGSLLELHNNNLITLKSDEKEIINKNIEALQKEADRIQKDKDTILAIYNADPYLSYKAGVYFTDTPEEAQLKLATFLNKNPQYNTDMIENMTVSDSAGNQYYVAMNRYTGQEMYRTKIGEKVATGGGTLTTQATPGFANAKIESSVREDAVQLASQGTDLDAGYRQLRGLYSTSEVSDEALKALWSQINGIVNEEPSTEEIAQSWLNDTASGGLMSEVGTSFKNVFSPLVETFVSGFGRFKK